MLKSICEDKLVDSHFMRKVRKLKREPKRFFKDTRINKYAQSQALSILRLAEGKIDGKVQKNDIDNVFKSENRILKPIEVFDFDFMLNGLRNKKVVGVYIEPLNPSHKNALCILEKERNNFIIKFLDFIYREGLLIKYKFKDGTKSPKSVNEFYKDLFALQSVDIRLSTSRVIGQDLSLFWFRLEFCQINSEFILFPEGNHISRKLRLPSIRDKDFFKKGIMNYSDISNLPHEKEINFDIDLVFTWVNSDDEDWQKLYSKFKPDYDSDANSNSRFKNRQELKYALRSWDLYGKFVRNIYIVSNCKPPEWLNLEKSNLFWVNHEDIIPEEFLPTFSSHAIETSLHKIEGLSDHFIYSNDDFFLLKPLSAHDFFYHNGIAKIRLESYGNVNGDVLDSDPDYLNGARNSNKLLERDFNKFTTQLHTHSPYSMNVSVLNEMHERYKLEFNRTLSNKFRSSNDLSVASYFYSHYAILTGKALEDYSKTELIQQNHNFGLKLTNILNHSKKSEYRKLPLSVCLNDGQDSHLNEEWNTKLANFLNELYPGVSSYEKQNVV